MPTRPCSRACARATKAAYTEIVRRYHPALVRVASAHVRSASLAEEVAQDAWLAVLQGLPRFEGAARSAPGCSIVANLAKTRGKREARGAVLGARARRAGTRAAFDPTQFLADGHWVEHPRVARSEQRLHSERDARAHRGRDREAPQVQRTVITSATCRGFDSGEVCRLLGLSEANQRVLLHRARAKVRRTLDATLVGD
jgi:RNA polymerase sigma-70 factor (ECF subfamily)